MTITKSSVTQHPLSRLPPQLHHLYHTTQRKGCVSYPGEVSTLTGLRLTFTSVVSEC